MTADASGENGTPLPEMDLTPAIRRVVATRLAWLMRNRNMSQGRLAEISGVSTAVISRLLRQQRTITADAVVRLSLALGVRSDWLLGLKQKDRGNKDV